MNSRTSTALGTAILAVLMIATLPSCGPGESASLVVYASQDQVYAEPILAQFSQLTGIKVRAIYDSEAVKTVGLANRLLAEAKHPQADLFWNNEELRTRQLAAEGIFESTGGWKRFGYRTRSLVINTKLWSDADLPRDLSSLTNARWKGKIALAYPLFGSTATHLLVLKQRWGESRWNAWCEALLANQPFLVDGNSLVVQSVGRGDAILGLTDSDDIAAGIREGLTVREVELGADGLPIPNTLGLVKGSRHLKEAAQLSDFLQSSQVINQLIQANALKGPSSPSVPAHPSEADWRTILTEMPTTVEQLRRRFLR